MKSKTFPVLLMCLLVNLLLAGVLVYGFRDIQNKNKETSLVLGKVDEALGEESLASSIRRMQSNSASELTTLESLKLKESEIVSLIEEIEGDGRSLGVTVDISSVNIEEKNPSNPTMPRKIRFVVEGQGDWRSVSSFMRVIETLPYRLMIDESTLQKGEGGWSSRTVVSVYSFN